MTTVALFRILAGTIYVAVMAYIESWLMLGLFCAFRIILGAELQALHHLPTRPASGGARWSILTVGSLSNSKRGAGD